MRRIVTFLAGLVLTVFAVACSGTHTNTGQPILTGIWEADAVSTGTISNPGQMHPLPGHRSARYEFYHNGQVLETLQSEFGTEPVSTTYDYSFVGNNTLVLRPVGNSSGAPAKQFFAQRFANTLSLRSQISTNPDTYEFLRLRLVP